jgi:hypothetical protein
LGGGGGERGMCGGGVCVYELTWEVQPEIVMQSAASNGSVCGAGGAWGGGVEVRMHGAGHEVKSAGHHGRW